MNQIKTLLVGAGRVAQHYLKIFQTYQNELSSISICEVIDPELDQAKNLAKYFQCGASEDLEISIDKVSPDLVIILTPSYLHFSHAEIALKSNCHVLVEKPSTLLLEDSYKLQEIAAERQLKLGTVVQNRFNLATQFAKKSIEHGWLGRLQSVAVRLAWSRSQEYYEDLWHGRWLSDGGVISQQGFHHIDIARFLCGEVKSVFSYGATLNHQIEVDDTSVAVVNFENCALGTFELTTTSPDRDIEASIKIIGSEGYIEIGGVGLNKINNFFTKQLQSSKIHSLANLNSENFENGYGISHYRVLQKFAEDITSGQNSYFTWDDTTRTLEVIHALYASQERQVQISISDKVRSTRLGRS